mmetsp:Transcript_123164/g.344748  ORF Transcript_123164/g.344748 Transcript_123164/m.344748 type:complete len:236 (+) Transcript_123164:725-1432(+)
MRRKGLRLADVQGGEVELCPCTLACEIPQRSPRLHLPLCAAVLHRLGCPYGASHRGRRPLRRVQRLRRVGRQQRAAHRVPPSQAHTDPRSLARPRAALPLLAGAVRRRRRRRSVCPRRVHVRVEVLARGPPMEEGRGEEGDHGPPGRLALESALRLHDVACRADREDHDAHHRHRGQVHPPAADGPHRDHESRHVGQHDGLRPLCRSEVFRAAPGHEVNCLLRISSRLPHSGDER